MIKETLGLFSVLIAAISYVPYIRGMIKGTVKPHAFSWFVWSLLCGIAFAAQLNKGAGAGSWVMGFTAIVLFGISVSGFFIGKRDIIRADYYCFIAALAAIPLWLITKDPTLSVILITMIDAVAFVPTFRKSYHKPREELIFTWTISCVKFIPGILALDHYNVSTVLYPASLIVMNGCFVLMLIWRRGHIQEVIQ